jgi:hypothetical protein
MVAALDNASKKSGRRALVVPELDAKLEYLLTRAGRQYKWLTEVLASPDGRSPSASSISMWKKTGRIPVDYVISLNYVFALDEGLLELDDLEVFKKLVDSAAKPGSGRYWKTLLERADETRSGLALVIEGGLAPRRLANLSFSRPERKTPLLEEVPLDAGVRFTIPKARLESLVTKEAELPLSIILCCEDRLGWKTLSPDRHHHGFESEATRWILPGSVRGPMFLDGTLGLHGAVSVAFAGKMPKSIADAFVSDRTVWATDALAAWLFTTNTPYIVLRRQFLAIAGRR